MNPLPGAQQRFLASRQWLSGQGAGFLLLGAISLRLNPAPASLWGATGWFLLVSGLLCLAAVLPLWLLPEKMFHLMHGWESALDKRDSSDGS